MASIKLHDIKTFDVTDYGARGNGSTDDSAAFQAAFNAAIAIGGKVIIPLPDVYYNLGSTINVLPGAPNQLYVDVDAHGWNMITGGPTIKYSGAINQPVFKIVGLKQSIWTGLKVGFTAGRSGCQAYDIDTTVAAGSTSFVTFKNCHVDLVGVNCVGWRTGHISGGGADISNYQWENCIVYGDNSSAGQIAYHNEGVNCLSQTWVGGFVAFCKRAYSNLSGAGASQSRGNGSVFFFGMGCSGNECDFEFTFEQAYTVNGGRFENGQKFLTTTAGSHHPAITVVNVECNNYCSGHGPLMEMKTAGTLHIINSRMIRTGGWDDVGSVHPMITLNSSGNVGTLIIDGGGTKATTPHLVQSGTWKVYRRGMSQFSDANGVYAGSHYTDLNG